MGARAIRRVLCSQEIAHYQLNKTTVQSEEKEHGKNLVLDTLNAVL